MIRKNIIRKDDILGNINKERIKCHEKLGKDDKIINENKNKVIILDNAGSHRNQLVKDEIKKVIIYCILFLTNII